MKFRSPLAWALLAGLAVLVAAFAPVALQMLQPRAPSSPPDGLAAPWQIERGAQGELHAFGLRLPGSTLNDALQRWGDDLRVALIESRAQPAALEAYTDRWSGGGVNGRLVLASDAVAASVERWRSRAVRRETIDAQAQRWQLHPDDRAEALRSGVAGLSFLPASRVDAATLQARFGAAAEVLPGDGRIRHWLYPGRGLVISWDEGSGKAVLQVVALADFEHRLRAPLLAAARPAADPTSERR